MSASLENNQEASCSELDTEFPVCIICAKEVVPATSNPEIDRSDRSYLFSICCQLLHTEMTDELVNLWNNSKRFSMCDSCESILKSFKVLHDQLVTIKNSIRKTEIDTKIQIIKTQTKLHLLNESEGDEVILFKNFCDLALKDFHPTLQLSKITVASSDISKQRKNKPRIRRQARKRIKAVEVEILEGFNEETRIKLEEIESLGNKYDDGNDCEISLSGRINEGNIKTAVAESILKTESLDLPDDVDFDSHHFSDDFGTDYPFSPGVQSNPNTCDIESQMSSEKVISKKRRTRTKGAGKVLQIKSKVSKRKERRKKIPVKEKDGMPMINLAESEAACLYRSIKYYFNEAENVFQCGSCMAKRNNHINMRTHISHNHPVEGYGKWTYKGVNYSLEKETGHLKCDSCNKTFNNRYAVVNHIKSRHNEEGNILPWKEKVYKTKDAKNRPEQIEEGKWLFKGVVVTKDETTGNFQCGQCGRVRKSKHSLFLHVRGTHDFAGKEDNPCPECGRKFMTPYSLKIHMDIHREKSYQCEQCGQIFQQKANMYRHVARIHKQVRPFICEYCTKSFFSRKDCDVHVRTHTKEKPYLCQVPNCGMSFSLLASKQKHESRIHSNPSIEKL